MFVQIIFHDALIFGQVCQTAACWHSSVRVRSLVMLRACRAGRVRSSSGSSIRNRISNNRSASSDRNRRCITNRTSVVNGNRMVSACCGGCGVGVRCVRGVIVIVIVIVIIVILTQIIFITTRVAYF